MKLSRKGADEAAISGRRVAWTYFLNGLRSPGGRLVRAKANSAA